MPDDFILSENRFGDPRFDPNPNNQQLRALLQSRAQAQAAQMQNVSQQWVNPALIQNYGYSIVTPQMTGQILFSGLDAASSKPYVRTQWDDDFDKALKKLNGPPEHWFDEDNENA